MQKNLSGVQNDTLCSIGTSAGKPEMSEFTALLKQVRDCTLCSEHLPLGPRPIVQLHPAARVLVAGQAPGSRVHASGIPFDDPSGDRLRDWMGLTAEQFYQPEILAILPMGFCYPGTGNSGDLPPRPECAPAWRESLLAQLPKLETILVIGQYAQNWHLKSPASTVTENVSNWRDSWPRLIPLPHPSPRNNRWLRRNPWFEAELVPRIQERVASLV